MNMLMIDLGKNDENIAKNNEVILLDPNYNSITEQALSKTCNTDPRELMLRLLNGQIKRSYKTSIEYKIKKKVKEII